MGAELGHHLGYPAGAAKPEAEGNQRNGTTGKTVLTGEGPLRVEIPRDRDGTCHFSPFSSQSVFGVFEPVRLANGHLEGAQGWLFFAGVATGCRGLAATGASFGARYEWPSRTMQ